MRLHTAESLAMLGRIWIIAIVAGAIGAVVTLLAPSLGAAGLEDAAMAAILPLGFYAAGLVAVILLPEHPVGHRLLAVGSLHLLAMALSVLATLSGAELAWVLVGASAISFWLGVAAVYDALARYPDGHYAFAPARLIALAAVVVPIVLIPIGMLVRPMLPSMINAAERPNPVHIGVLEPAAGFLETAIAGYIPTMILIGFGVMLLRYRRRSADERAQLRWPIAATLVVVVAVFSGGILIETIGPAVQGVIFVVVAAALPASFLVGLLQRAREAERVAVVEASRRRIAAAAVEERRRIERDLHDGAQQHLLALLARVELARQHAGPGSAVADELVQIADSVREVHRDLRELARGIYPTVLADQGLAEAVASAVERLPLRTKLEVAEPVRSRRFPQAIEGAAYLFVLEGLANVMKHAAADRASVRLAGVDGTLEVAIADNGRGFDHDSLPPGALDGLRDRLAAVGGSLRVDSRPGGGTRLVGSFPVG